MSEVGLERNELWTKLSDDKSFDLSCEFEEKEVVLLDHYGFPGVSAIRKNSGIACLICRRFFPTDAAAKDHAKDFLHYRRYCDILLHRNEGSFGQDTTQKRHKLKENEQTSLEVECYQVHDSYQEREDGMQNEGLWTIKECAGIVCVPCMKFFVNEASAGQHVKSLAHYRKCYNVFENVAEKLGENFMSSSHSDHISCKEEKESSETVTTKTSETKIHYTDNHCNIVDLQINIKESKKRYIEDIESPKLESTENNLDSLIILDNDWWCEFDNKLESLLHDISEECGEEIR